MATFTNRAFLTYNNITTGSNTVSGEILETLSATKTAVVDEYAPGDRLTYVVSILNAGQTAFTGLSFTDDLGAYTEGTATLYPLTYAADSVTYYVNGVLQPTPTVTAGDTLTVTGITVPAGGNAVIVYSADVNAFAPLDVGGTVVNTVTVTGGGLSTPVTATETVTAISAPALTITKGISPATVTENSSLTYSFSIQNYGSSAAVTTDNLTVTDTFDPILSDIVVTLDGVTLTAGTDYTYDETTGVFSTAVGRITVPAATYTRDPVTGAIVTDPGSALLTVTGTV